MKTFTRIFFVMILAIGITTSLAAQKKSKDKEAVEKALLNYLEGGTNGESARVVAAFHPSASMKYVDNKTGEFKDVPIADFLERVKQNDGKKLDRTHKIVHLDIYGTAAHAKLEIDGGTYIFHDYMNLLKIDGEWKVVSKIFYREDKSDK